jgi:hypothetical protein
MSTNFNNVDWRDEDCRSCEHWLFRHKLDTKVVAQATHLCLRGGMFAVPAARRSELYRMMTRDINGSVPFFLCEKRSDIFLFYLDLDYAAAAVIDSDTIFKISIIIQRAVRSCYREYTGAEWLRRGLIAVLVCDEPTPVVVQKRSFVKTGIHIIFPNLYVNEEQANALVLYTIQYMTSNWPQHGDALSWASVIDTGVYGNGKGLRMLGSRKCLRCSQCSRRAGAERNMVCTECRGLGYALCGLGRPYAPTWVIQGGESTPAENTERFRNVPHYALNLSSILSDETRPCSGFSLPDDFVCLERRNLTSMRRMLNNEIPLNDDRSSALQDYFRRLRPEWSRIVINKVILNEGHKKHGHKSSETFLCKAFGPGSKFCSNVMHEHKTSTIYFTVSARGIGQRCYSRKPPAPGFQSCAKFCSPLVPITDPALHMILFPMVNAVGAELDREFGNLFGAAWGAETDSALAPRATILRRKRIIDRLAIADTIPPPMKKERRPEPTTWVSRRDPAHLEDYPSSDEEDFLEEF